MRNRVPVVEKAGNGGGTLTRRDFLRSSALAAVAAGIELEDRAAGSQGGAKALSRPNILVIKSDQHNARCMGVNGHKQVKTPHLDELARAGVNFTGAFVQNPICSPSRMCYLAGQYVHNHGVYGLTRNEPIPQSLPSMFSELKKLGYRTGIVGHIHVKHEWLEPHCDQFRDMYVPNDPYTAYLDSKGIKDKSDSGELYNVAKDPWEMTNLYDDPKRSNIREELRRKLFDWLLLTSRYGVMLPSDPPGADGKTTPAQLKKHIEKGSLNYM